MNPVKVTRPLCIGFHGCEKKVAEKIVLRREKMKPSKNKYDWLGAGCYFWENDPDRALEFAKEHDFKEPFVVGAVLDLGYCLDLTCRENSLLLKMAYNSLIKPAMDRGEVSYRNRVPKNGITDDILLRYLDCAVIEALHDFIKEYKYPSFDSVRAGFWEGSPLYEDAGFREKNHIQICIRNPQCIRGLFVPDGFSL